MKAAQIVSAIAVGVFVLAIGTSSGHGGPADGPGSDNTVQPPGPVSLPAPLEISISENPVFFLPNQTSKTVDITWTPQPDSKVWVNVTEGSGAKAVWSKTMDNGLSGPLKLEVTYNHFYWVWVCREIHDTCPLAIVTTERIDINEPTLQRRIPVPIPEPPENRRSDPQTPELPGGQGLQRDVPKAQREHPINAGEGESRVR